MRAVFGEAELYLCEWHLRHALERLMAKIREATSVELDHRLVEPGLVVAPSPAPRRRARR